MPKLEKVLILSASYGEGHHQAAVAVREALVEAHPEIEVNIVDYMQMVHPTLNLFARYFYIKSVRFAPTLYGLFYKGTSKIKPTSLIQRRLNQLGLEDIAEYLLEYKPDLILSTFPTPAGVIAMLKKQGLCHIPTATVITDHAIHSQWIHENTDHYFVGSEHVRRGLTTRGIPNDRISVTGIPISAKFMEKKNRDDIRARLGLESDQPTLLIMAGSYGVMTDIEGICDELFHTKNRMQIIVVSGRNEKLRLQLEAQAQEATNPVWVFGFTKEVDQLMAVSDLMVTKAGGLTISEALAMELPMLLYRPIPGQEVQNTSFLVKSRVAAFARNRKQIVQLVNRLFFEDVHKLARMKEHTKNIQKSTAATDIARILFEVESQPILDTESIPEHYYAEQS